MTYRDRILKLGDDTAAQVTAVWIGWKAGKISKAEAVALIAAFIEAANNRATALADLALAATLTLATRRIVPPVGLVPPVATDRLHQAAGTLLDVLPHTPDPEARVARLGRSEPLTRAAEARGEGLAKSTLVEGWTRNVSGSACQLCNWWRRDGRVWPKDHRMPQHKGCSCTQTPVLVERVKPVSL